MNFDLRQVAAGRALVRSGAARAIRVGAGLSIREVAAAVGASPAAVYRWEKGERVPRAAHAARYGDLLLSLTERPYGR